MGKLQCLYYMHDTISRQQGAGDEASIDEGLNNFYLLRVV